jgi:hypothetical protein
MEATEVEADAISTQKRFKDKTPKEKGAGQYVKESLAFLRRTRKPAR